MNGIDKNQFPFFYASEVYSDSSFLFEMQSDAEKSSIPLDVVYVFGRCVCEESQKYGDFEKKKFQQTMQDFLSKARTGEEHFDRDGLVHDVYYSVLLTAEVG